ncbi:YfhO family protein, partial [Staphylococcus ureilyticus]|nr:YfhO family protein [Staphylococcus ureilyticus]
NINNYANHRLYNNSTYKTGVENQLYRTQPDKDGNINIAINPRGSYYFDIQSLHGENYSKLKKAYNKKQNHYYNDIKNGVKVKLAPHTKGIATINIPYRDGMVAYVDHKKVKPKKVNYMMTGVPVTKQDSEITIKYRPKYWFTMIIISVISILISIFWCLKKKSKLK